MKYFLDFKYVHLSKNRRIILGHQKWLSIDHYPKITVPYFVIIKKQLFLMCVNRRV